MKKDEELCEGWRARWWLNTEYSTDLRCEELMLYESDLFNRSEVNRGPFDCIGGDTKP